MGNKSWLVNKPGILLGILMIASLSCGLPVFEDNITDAGNTVKETADALATIIIGSQTALALDEIAPAVKTVENIIQTAVPDAGISKAISTAMPVDILTHMPGILTQVPSLPQSAPENTPQIEADNLPHHHFPRQPGAAKVDVEDESCASSSSQQAAPALSERYDVNLFERPFTQNNAVYLPDVDIEKAEFSSDDIFYYAAIYLNNVDSSTQTLDANYGVELDTDQDGRGDYLIWTNPPKSTKWSINYVSVYIDVNNDVGSKTPLHCDAPSSGNGYETNIFNRDNFTDADTAWSRISPANPKSVQIAFKRDILDTQSFLWAVWADKGLNDPGKFDYNDVYVDEEAGSSLENDTNYPIKAIFSVDNSCRMLYGGVATGNEPGICSQKEADEKTIPIIDITKIPIPEIPGLP